MTPVLAVLLYLRLVLYPLCTVGFMLMFIFSNYPQERRQMMRWRSYLWLTLAVLFATFGLTVLLRLTTGDINALRFADYAISLPLAVLAVTLALNVRLLGRRI